jgi:photosystem II stability/assembly factor-like uncharacterized protein
MRQRQTLSSLFVLVVFFVTLTAGPAYSSGGSGWVTSLVIDPQNPSVLYAGTYGGGVFKSTDGGVIWSAVGLANMNILSLVIDPHTPSTIYAGEETGAVYKTTDGGATWNPTILNPLSSGICGPCGSILALAIDPQTPTTLFGAGDVIYTQTEDGFLYTAPGGVYKSTDTGATFASLIPLGTAIGFTSVAVVRGSTDEYPTIYAGQTVSPWWVPPSEAITTGGVLKSTDGGMIWEWTGLTSVGSVLAVAVDRLNPMTVYAAESGGTVFKSNDGGASWSTTGLTGVAVGALAIDPESPSTIFAGGFGVLKSIDAGMTWNPAGLADAGFVSVIAINPATLSTVYAGTGSGVYRSTDGGSTWTATGAITWPAVSSVSLNPTIVVGGSVATGTVTLTSAAPPGGAVVGLGNSEYFSGIATVPASVTVPPGALSADFPVSTSVVLDSTGGLIWAFYGGIGRQAALKITPTAPLDWVWLNPMNVTGGSTSTGMVQLNVVAPAGGVAIALSSSEPAVASVPANVTVAAGATSATFTIFTTAVTASTTVTITASLSGATKSALLSVNPAVALASVGLSPTSLTGGASSIGTVTLSAAAPAGGAVIGLASTDAAVAVIRASVAVAAGGTSATFTISTNPVNTSAAVTISGTYGGVTRAAVLTVNPPTPSSVNLNPTSVTGGASSIGTVVLSGPAPGRGVAVALSSSDPAIAAVPPSVTVAAGETSATFTISTPPCASGTATISASFGGVSRSVALTVTTTSDTVAIQAADYFRNRQVLRVEATSTTSTAALSVYETPSGAFIGTLTRYDGSRHRGEFTWPVNPQNITVRSDRCGLAASNVTVK